MAIAKLDFARGQVVNPLDSIGDDLLKFGSSLHQQEKDRLAAEKQNELLAMQKQEHQMKLDEVNNTKRYYELLSKPLEMKDTAALHNNMTALQPHVDKMAFTDDEVLASTPVGTKLYGTETVVTPEMVADAQKRVDPLAFVSKQKAQGLLGEFGSTMSQKEEYQPTHLEQLGMIAKQMGSNTPTILAKEMEAARLAAREKRILDEKTYTKEIADAGNDAITAVIAKGKYGDTHNGAAIGINGETGEPIYSTGSNNKKTMHVEEFNNKQLQKANEITQKAYSTFFDTALERTNDKTNPLSSTKAKATADVANGLYNELVTRGYPAEVVYANINTLVKTIGNDPAAWKIFSDPSTLKLPEEQLKALEAGKKMHEAAIRSDYELAARKDGAILPAPSKILTIDRSVKPQADKVRNEAKTVFGTDANTSAVLGVIAGENARFDPTNVSKDGDPKGNKFDSYGLFQWNRERVDAYNAWAAQNGKPPLGSANTTTSDQLAFAKYEIDTNPAYKASKAILSDPNASAADKTRVLTDNYVRPYDPNKGVRESRAEFASRDSGQQYIGSRQLLQPQANGNSGTVNDAYSLKIANDVARKEKAKQDLALSRMSPDEKIRASVLGNVAGFAGGVLPSRDMAVVNAPSIETSPLAGDAGKLSKKELTDELIQATKDGNYDNMLTFGKMLKDDYKMSDDEVKKIAGLDSKTNLQQLFANASTAPDAPVFKVLPPKSVEQQRIDNSWSGQLTNKLIGTGGHATWNNLGKIASQIGDNAALLGTAVVGGANRVGEFFTQPAFDAYNWSTGRSIGNPFAHGAALAEAEHKRLLGKNSAVPAESIEQTMAVQQLLGPAAAIKLGAIPAVVAEQAPYASAIGSRVLGNVAEGTQHLASKIPVLGRPFRPAATKPVLPAPATMTDDATIALKQDAVKETTTTGAKQASSREAQIDAKVSERIEKAQKLARYEFLKSKETLDRIERRELDALEKLFSGK